MVGLLLLSATYTSAPCPPPLSSPLARPPRPPLLPALLARPLGYTRNSWLFNISYIFVLPLILPSFDLSFLLTADYIWETNNKGKLWKDIKGKYEVAEE